MGLFESFSADADAQQNGKWVPYGDCRVLVAFSGDGNDRWDTTLERHTRPYRRYIENDKMVKSASMKQEISDAVMRAYCHAVVLDWENVKENGVELEFSPKECFRVFKALPAFFADIREFSGNIQNYQPESDDGDSKNS
jgi:hypothetical protein